MSVEFCAEMDVLYNYKWHLFKNIFFVGCMTNQVVVCWHIIISVFLLIKRLISMIITLRIRNWKNFNTERRFCFIWPVIGCFLFVRIHFPTNWHVKKVLCLFIFSFSDWTRSHVFICFSFTFLTWFSIVWLLITSWYLLVLLGIYTILM